jgi:Fe-S cluster biogenesis protein NfuA
MNSSIRRHIHIYTEASPNPDSIKIVLNLVLSPEGRNFNFIRSESNELSPLAEALFSGFPWISQVFIMNNFITITRESDIDWYELLAEVKPFIKSWFEEEKSVFAGLLIPDKPADQTTAPQSETEKQIIEVLEEYVRPAVESDGGAIAFHSFEDGVVQVELRGSCSGCPSSALTLKQGIENLLTRMVPGVREVVAVNR